MPCVIDSVRAQGWGWGFIEKECERLPSIGFICLARTKCTWVYQILYNISIYALTWRTTARVCNHSQLHKPDSGLCTVQVEWLTEKLRAAGGCDPAVSVAGLQAVFEASWANSSTWHQYSQLDCPRHRRLYVIITQHFNVECAAFSDLADPLPCFALIQSYTINLYLWSFAAPCKLCVSRQL